MMWWVQGTVRAKSITKIIVQIKKKKNISRDGMFARK